MDIKAAPEKSASELKLHLFSQQHHASCFRPGSAGSRPGGGTGGEGGAGFHKQKRMISLGGGTCKLRSLIKTIFMALRT